MIALWLCSLPHSSSEVELETVERLLPAPERVQAEWSPPGLQESASQARLRRFGLWRPTCVSCQRTGASSSASCRSNAAAVRVVVAADADERAALLAGAAVLARPVLFPADRGTDAEPSFSALHGLYWLAINMADTRPVLLAVDDAHWADVDSLRWLIYLARRLAGVPLALVLATRQAEAGPVQELLDELLPSPRWRSSTRAG
jgi:hypothetical protein